MPRTDIASIDAMSHDVARSAPQRQKGWMNYHKLQEVHNLCTSWATAVTSDHARGPPVWYGSDKRWSCGQNSSTHSILARANI